MIKMLADGQHRFTLLGILVYALAVGYFFSKIQSYPLSFSPSQDILFWFFWMGIVVGLTIAFRECFLMMHALSKHQKSLEFNFLIPSTLGLLLFSLFIENWNFILEALIIVSLFAFYGHAIHKAKMLDKQDKKILLGWFSLISGVMFMFYSSFIFFAFLIVFASFHFFSKRRLYYILSAMLIFLAPLIIGISSTWAFGIPHLIDTPYLQMEHNWSEYYSTLMKISDLSFAKILILLTIILISLLYYLYTSFSLGTFYMLHLLVLYMVIDTFLFAQTSLKVIWNMSFLLTSLFAFWSVKTNYYRLYLFIIFLFFIFFFL